jgi:predicted DCC family thiol-disulfide oxidoreductase YuxK
MDPEDVARIALDAADAVMFSEEAIERAAEALATADGRIWSVLGPITKEQYRAFVRAVVAALRGEA